MNRFFQAPAHRVLTGSVFVLAFSFVCAGTTLTGCFSRDRAIFEKPVLEVNGHSVTTKEFADRLALRLKDFDALHAKDDTNVEHAKDDTVQSFVFEFIERDYAAKNGIRVASNEVDAEVAGIRSHYPDDFAFRRALGDENMSLDAWKKALEFTLLQKKIFAKVTEGLPDPTDEEMKQFYDANKAQFQKPARVRLRQIVLEKEDDAERILAQLEKGADLAKLASEFSVAPEGAKGGDTGWIEKGTLDVFEPAFKMKVGARSKIIKSPYGYHIYQLLKKEPEAHLSFQDAKAKIRARMLEDKAQRAFSTWLEGQVKQSSVRRNDALIGAIKVTTRGS